jgi:tetratricopeptide (TPR) repeat protein
MTILQELGYLALAIVQAGAYICKTGCGLAQAMFLEEYRDHVQKIDDYEWTVYTTWTVSFERLSPRASTFLNICAFMHHDGISATIFQNASVNITNRVLYDSQGSNALEMAAIFLDSFRNEVGIWDLHKFLTIMTEIRSYSLIDLDERNNIYSVHPLVHSWTRSRIYHETTIHECSQYILGLSINWRFETEDLSYRRMLLPHVDASLREYTVPDMAVWLSLVYSEGGQWKKTERLEVQAIEMTKRVLGEEHPVTLAKLGNLASTYIDQGRSKEEAEELQVKVMEVRKRVLGEEHRSTLISMGELALSYSKLGRWQQAEELNVKVVEIRKRVLGEEHPDTLTGMANLALTYSKQGRWKEAEELSLKVIEVRKRVLGEDHPGALASMANLASTFRCQGRLEEAEELVTKVMKFRMRVLRVDHPDTLTSMADLALTYSIQGRWKEAEELQASVMEIRKRILGEEHPDTLMSMENLASMYRSQGRRRESKALEVRVMELRKRILGEDHPDTLRSIQVVVDGAKLSNRWSMWLRKGSKLLGRNSLTRGG